MEPLLKIEKLVSHIGLFTILHDVNIEINKGEAVVILGRNGVGKTTLLKAIMGLVKSKSGTLEFENKNIIERPTYEIARKGIGYVPEDYGVFDLLSVEENIKIAISKKTTSIEDKIAYIFDLFPDLKIAYKRSASTLSGGQRQMLSISKVLVNENKLMLVDEPSKGLAPIIVERLARALREISKTTTVLLVEQNFALACAVGSRYYIIDEGRTVKNGKVQDLVKDSNLQKKYLGVT
ncbi:MAG: ABC transporter ATP-binding protein [Clostridiales bacterium]|nr:ABC transporter ATP-binding protein [Clostridiales bacterium]